MDINKTMLKWTILAAWLVMLITCSSGNKNKPNPVYGEVEKVDAIGDIPERMPLDQNWDEATREKFWFTSQGTQVIPYVWFTYLEQNNDSQHYFRDAAYMEAFRYMSAASTPCDKKPGGVSACNPAGLPIGFAVDVDRDTGDAWLGITCAACHTNQIDYAGEKFLIEGGPTLANHTGFLNELHGALDKTANDPDRFKRFANNVLGEPHSVSYENKLRNELVRVTQHVRDRITINMPPSDYPDNFISYARFDAFGVIQNEISAVALHEMVNRHPLTAPVSYPFLWGTPQSDVVQWNGSAPNRLQVGPVLLGPIMRNITEAIGAYGSPDIQKAPWWKRVFLRQPVSYKAKVKPVNVGHLEKWLHDLRSPKWPETVLPPIDSALAEEGRGVYVATGCIGCHEIKTRDEEADDYNAHMISIADVETDPQLATNAAENTVKTLILEGVKSNVIAGEKFTEVEPATALIFNMAFGFALAHPLETYEGAAIPRRKKMLLTTGSDEAEIEKNLSSLLGAYAEALSNTDSTLKYKARPLTGIWATAPYLHNGSVPNLRELLKKPEDRVNTFWVGSREYDPENVGFVSTEGLDVFDVLRPNSNEILPGNSNQGHSFGTHLPDSEKAALLEFLKTL